MESEMEQIQTAITTGSMLSGLSSSAILGILVVILGYVAYKTYNHGILEHGEKLDKITKATEDVVRETKTLNSSTKISLESSKETRDLLVKMSEEQNKKVKEDLDEIKKSVKKVEDNFVFTGTGIRREQ
jgi:hypothetical protein